MIKQKLFGENLPTNRELAQMAGAHKNEKVTFIPTDKGIRIIIHHKDYAYKGNALRATSRHYATFARARCDNIDTDYCDVRMTEACVPQIILDCDCTYSCDPPWVPDTFVSVVATTERVLVTYKHSL